VDDRLRDLFRDVLGIAERDYRDNLRQNETEGWDSITHLSLMLAVEQTFAVSIDPEEAARLTSVAELKQALARRGVR